MKLIKYNILYLICGLASYGQEIREIEFTVYAQFPVRNVEYQPVSPEALEAGAKNAVPIKIKTHSILRMGPYPFKGFGRIEFRSKRDDSLVAKVNIPETTSKCLLIFIKNPNFRVDPENNLKWLVYPFDDSLENLPRNGLVFINISGKELDGIIEQKRIKLPRGESDTYKVQESLPVNLWARNFDGSKLLPALVKTYNFEQNHRYLMIFFPPVLKGSADLDVRLLRETLEPEPQ